MICHSMPYSSTHPYHACSEAGVIPSRNEAKIYDIASELLRSYQVQEISCCNLDLRCVRVQPVIFLRAKLCHEPFVCHEPFAVRPANPQTCHRGYPRGSRVCEGVSQSVHSSAVVIGMVKGTPPLNPLLYLFASVRSLEPL
jgi:hypothetical protein